MDTKSPNKLLSLDLSLIQRCNSDDKIRVTTPKIVSIPGRVRARSQSSSDFTKNQIITASKRSQSKSITLRLADNKLQSPRMPKPPRIPKMYSPKIKIQSLNNTYITPIYPILPHVYHKQDPWKIYLELIDQSTGVRVKDRKWKLLLYKQCFIGKECVDWLNQKYQWSRKTCVSYLQLLYDQSLIAHVCNKHKIEDDHLFYIFIELHKPNTTIILRPKDDILSDYTTEEVIMMLQDPTSGIELTTKKTLDCFRANKTIIWLYGRLKLNNYAEAIIWGQNLQQNHYIVSLNQDAIFYYNDALFYFPSYRPLTTINRKYMLPFNAKNIEWLNKITVEGWSCLDIWKCNNNKIYGAVVIDHEHIPFRLNSSNFYNLSKRYILKYGYILSTYHNTPSFILSTCYNKKLIQINFRESIICWTCCFPYIIFVCKSHMYLYNIISNYMHKVAYTVTNNEII